MLEKPEGRIKNGQSRDTGSIWHISHWTKTSKKEGVKVMVFNATFNNISVIS